MPLHKPSKSLPFISVILPNFNHGGYLRQSLEAICLEQDDLIEILVIDDGSTDNSLEIVNKLKSKYSKIRSFYDGANLGVVTRLNQGLLMAQGRYVYFAGADDQVLPNFFSEVTESLKLWPQAPFCCTDHFFLQTERNEWFAQKVGNWDCYVSPQKYRKATENGVKSKFHGCGVVFDTFKLRKMGGFDKKLEWYCDWYLIQRMALEEGFCYVPKYLAVFRQGPLSYSKATLSNSSIHDEVVRALLRKTKAELENHILKGFFQIGTLTFNARAVKNIWKVAEMRMEFRWVPTIILRFIKIKIEVRKFLWRVFHFLFFRRGKGYFWNRIRNLLLIAFGAKISGNAQIYDSVIIESPWFLEIGNGAVIHTGCNLMGRGKIILETGVLLKERVTIETRSFQKKIFSPQGWKPCKLIADIPIVYWEGDVTINSNTVMESGTFCQAPHNFFI